MAKGVIVTEGFLNELTADQSVIVCLIMSHIVKWHSTDDIQCLVKAKQYIDELIEYEKNKDYETIQYADNSPFYSVFISRFKEDENGECKDGGKSIDSNLN